MSRRRRHSRGFVAESDGSADPTDVHQEIAGLARRVRAGQSVREPYEEDPRR